MTPTQRAAMEQALAALERADKISGYANNKRVIAELRAALAEQPAEQPAEHGKEPKNDE